jgi:dolichyl-phosphate beta-glucosyltransferase
LSAPNEQTRAEDADPAPDLSVIVPAFDESKRIAGSISVICSYLAQRPERCELVVVDDGSRDGTFETVCALANDAPIPVRVVRYQPNLGKGHALKVGFASARGRRVLFTDADLSVPIESADAMLAAIDDGADAAIGSRHLAGAEIATPQPPLRRWLGAVFTLLVRGLIAPVNDATCGFKAFRGDVGREVFGRVRIYDWSYDAEILFLLHRAGHRIRELPVYWEHREGTKVRPLRDGFRAFSGLLRIRSAALAGRYDRPTPVAVALEVWRSDLSSVVAGGSP